MKYLILIFPLLLISACSEKAVDPNKSQAKKQVNTSSPAANEEKVLDFKSLFEIAQQESLEIYNPREQELRASKNIGKLKADSFMKALLPEIEEGTSRRIEYGRKHGITAGPDQEFFIVVEDNIPDDSVQSDIRFFELRKTEQAWSIASVTSVWKCYEGRGHQDYSSKPCQ